eukprot:1146325-Pelagomonas_calceolata.AAC.1
MRGKNVVSTFADGQALGNVLKIQDTEVGAACMMVTSGKKAKLHLGSTGHAVQSKYLTSGAGINVFFEATEDGQHDLEVRVEKVT